jgi:hypothetical protein
MLDDGLAGGVRPHIIPESGDEFSLGPRELKTVMRRCRLMHCEFPAVAHAHIAQAKFLGLLAAHLAGVPHTVQTFLGHVLHAYYRVHRRLKGFPEQAHAPVEERELGWETYFTVSRLRTGLCPEVVAMVNLKRVLAGFMRSDRERADLPLLHRLLHVNFTSYLANNLHVKMDRMSVANALETPLPMLNTMLMGYLSSLPPPENPSFRAEIRLATGVTGFVTPGAAEA